MSRDILWMGYKIGENGDEFSPESNCPTGKCAGRIRDGQFDCPRRGDNGLCYLAEGEYCYSQE